ncbi:MAG: ABC transporter ATP-binding protein [Candidatus Dadabacteria bacterium]|nr:ABC transporter ATP-binding protein [Candidatus Dadabacteria bacterium]MCZ6639010.1 ABC transporter ATP-binding protein [Candidatus Dadabacteria bacterium]MCZ6864198.1 ABC transporter ATP-binding protein [Candidatus Dadabacteria bacterium]
MNKKKTIFSLLLKYKYSFLAGLIALTLVDICQLSIPLIIERVIDALTLEDATINDISKYGLYMLIIAIVMSIFRFFWRYFIMGAARKIEQSLRNDFFAHLQSLNFDFFSEKKVGDLMAHTVNDVETLKFACGLGVLVAYDGIFLLVFIFGAMLYISPQLTLYAFIPFPILGVVIYMFGKMIEQRFQRVQDSFSELTESARESISGIKVIKAFVRQDKELKDFARSSNNYLDRNLSLIKIWGVYQPIITFAAASATAIFLWLGGIDTITLDITLGSFAAILIYLTMLTWPMMAMGWAVDIIKRGNASLNRINAVLSTKPKSISEPNAIEFDIKGNIEFRNLSFSYKGKRALSNVSLKIALGHAMGITGATGSGKSTLFHLLTRIEDPPDNSIFIDGMDIKKIKRGSLRKGIIYVPQETTVFSGTIRDNISFMNPEITEAQIENAAKIAEIYDEIMEFPGGFDARVGERGLSLSGGQRQRVALARAILLKPSVLILDDVFSSLDLKTESLVLRNLRREMKESTLLAISSRVPSISGFDSIAVFENGRLVELGNHDELMAKSGIYHGLYKIQTFE